MVSLKLCLGIASDSTAPNAYGIFLSGGASNNTIGGIDSGNVIADNAKGGARGRISSRR